MELAQIQVIPALWLIKVLLGTLFTTSNLEGSQKLTKLLSKVILDSMILGISISHFMLLEQKTQMSETTLIQLHSPWTQLNMLVYSTKSSRTSNWRQSATKKHKFKIEEIKVYQGIKTIISLRIQTLPWTTIPRTSQNPFSLLGSTVKRSWLNIRSSINRSLHLTNGIKRLRFIRNCLRIKTSLLRKIFSNHL